VIPAFPVYLFDLDGTLLDSASDICGSVQQVLSETDERPDVSFEFLKGYIGRHLIDLFVDLYPHYSTGQIDRMIVRATRVHPRVVPSVVPRGRPNNGLTAAGRSKSRPFCNVGNRT